MSEGKKVEKKKTTIKEKTLNPVFNESLIFNVPYERIRQTSLNISVMDYDRMGRNELIGQIVLGSKSGPMEVKHWNEMFAKSRQPVAQWHILKDFGWGHGVGLIGHLKCGVIWETVCECIFLYVNEYDFLPSRWDGGG